MPAELPPELRNRDRAVLTHFDRGLVTAEDLENELLASAHEVAGQEFKRAHPDWAKDALFDQIAWETGFETKRQSQAELGASYALALAESCESARGLVGRIFHSPQWQQALKPVQEQLTDAATAGHDGLETAASTAWLAAWRGVLPPEARRAVRGAPIGSEASMIDLLESDREGDGTRVAQIIAASGRCGCVSPAVQLLRLRRSEDRPVDAAKIASLLDPADLAVRGEFGGMTHMAVELLADGEDAQAAEWSLQIADDELFHEAQTHDRGALRAYYDDRRERHHGPGRCIALCNESDARLLGALAFIDWVGGDTGRARARAAACDSGSAASGWSAAGVELLAGWVLTRHLEADDRLDPLLGMIERSGRSHVDLGLLGVQIHRELAALATVVGNYDAAAHHRALADWFTLRPMMHLHFEPFQFPSLLTRLLLVATN